MTGNINMGTHSVFNLKQPEKPKIELPSETDKPKDPPLSYDDLPSVIKNSQFVVTQSQNNLTGDLKMTNAQIANIKTPVEGESNYAANVTYLESKLQNPKRAFLSNTLPTTTSSPTISFNGYIPWLSTTNGSSSPTEPDFKSELADKCFTAEQENLKVKTAGLLVLSVRGTWNPTTATPTDDASTPTPTTISVNLTVTPDNSSGTVTSSNGSGSSEDTSATETLTIPLKLYSGESVQLQLPIKTASDIKMDTSSQISNGGSGSVSSSATLSSWSWEAALYPTDVTKNTPSTPSSPTDPSPSPTSPGTNTNTEQTP